MLIFLLKGSIPRIVLRPPAELALKSLQALCLDSDSFILDHLNADGKTLLNNCSDLKINGYCHEDRARLNTNSVLSEHIKQISEQIDYDDLAKLAILTWSFDASSQLPPEQLFHMNARQRRLNFGFAIFLHDTVLKVLLLPIFLRAPLHPEGRDMYFQQCGHSWVISRILNVASVLARVPNPFASAYNASKAAVAVYSDTLRLEVPRLGLEVKTLYMGEVSTPLMAADNINFGPESIYHVVEDSLKARTNTHLAKTMAPGQFARESSRRSSQRKECHYLERY